MERETRFFVPESCFHHHDPLLVVLRPRRTSLQRRYSHPVDRSTGVRSDQTVILGAIESAQAYPALRRVSYFDTATNKRLQFLTNNLPADHRRDRSRWQVDSRQATFAGSGSMATTRSAPCFKANLVKRPTWARQHGKAFNRSTTVSPGRMATSPLS